MTSKPSDFPFPCVQNIFINGFSYVCDVEHFQPIQRSYGNNDDTYFDKKYYFSYFDQFHLRFAVQFDSDFLTTAVLMVVMILYFLIIENLYLCTSRNMHAVQIASEEPHWQYLEVKQIKTKKNSIKANIVTEPLISKQ